MQALIALVCMAQIVTSVTAVAPVSQSITEVLREPLPSEDLSCTITEDTVLIRGAVFLYRIDRASGVVSGLEVTRGGRTVVMLREPVGLWLDDAVLANVSGGVTQVLEEGPAKVVVETKCLWVPSLPCTIRTTVYDDGVLVSEVTLTPEMEVVLRRGIRYEANATGRFTHYLHKRRDTNGIDCFKGALPNSGETVNMDTPTSCLEAFSDEAALALFTDMGDYYRSPESMNTAAILVEDNGETGCILGMRQHLIHVGPDGTPYTLRPGEAFTFRIGLAVAPNRLPHPRRRDPRMFIWVGDGKFPYPSDEEIRAAAHLGYTLFQMHRLGPPGEPRPPAEEFDRVLKTVHDAGMLFIWTANADLQYRHDPMVSKMVTEGQWVRWQGFNYGGKYRATMDAFCDTLATCLASPNGLADYRMECDRRMLERYPVDGMYIDDNLAYENCTLWKEHGHPQKIYDCLIELHEVNWRRRQTLKEKCPHAVLIDHSSHAFVLPVIAPFDCHLFGEGYTFPSIESFRVTFGSYENTYAQGCLWAGDSETTRCGAEQAYAFDLLSGGGQYSYLDWRLWPDKFPYASSVDANEPLFVKTYNLAQYYFGMYESEFIGSLGTTTPGTYAALYHNRIWEDTFVALANMTDANTVCSLADPGAPLQRLPSTTRVVVYDVQGRDTFFNQGGKENNPFTAIQLRPYQTRLFYTRSLPETGPYHLWGGKRITQHWDAEAARFTVRLQGPEGLEDWIVLGSNGLTGKQVLVNAEPVPFFTDTEKGLIYGKVIFGTQPITLDVELVESASQDIASLMPEKPIAPDDLTLHYYTR